MEGRREKRELQSKGIWRARGHGDLVKRGERKKKQREQMHTQTKKSVRNKNDTRLQKGIKGAEEKITKRKRMKVRNSVCE